MGFFKNDSNYMTSPCMYDFNDEACTEGRMMYSNDTYTFQEDSDKDFPSLIWTSLGFVFLVPFAAVSCFLAVITVRVAVDGKHRREVQTMRRNGKCSIIQAQVIDCREETSGSTTQYHLKVVYTVALVGGRLQRIQKTLNVKYKTYYTASRTKTIRVTVLDGFPLSGDVFEESETCEKSVHGKTILLSIFTLIWMGFILFFGSTATGSRAMVFVVLQIVAVALSAFAAYRYYTVRRFTETFANYVARDMQGDATMIIDDDDAPFPLPTEKNGGDDDAKSV